MPHVKGTETNDLDPVQTLKSPVSISVALFDVEKVVPNFSIRLDGELRFRQIKVEPVVHPLPPLPQVSKDLVLVQERRTFDVSHPRELVPDRSLGNRIYRRIPVPPRRFCCNDSEPNLPVKIRRCSQEMKRYLSLPVSLQKDGRPRIPPEALAWCSRMIWIAFSIELIS